MTIPAIGFAGMTHLGIVSAVAAAERGFKVCCYDHDADRIARLSRDELPVVEPGLTEIFAKSKQRVSFSSDASSLTLCDVVYIAADVPTDAAGSSDLSGIRTLIGTVNAVLAEWAVLVILCQVPPGFTRTLPIEREHLYYQVETLVFGRAVERATEPERFIIGCADPTQALPDTLRAYLLAFNCPIMPMRYESAELAKISINCCLVASVTVANTLAELSERIGADWSEIVPALRLDRRIGTYSYLAPGLGLAGGNLERDLTTVLRMSETFGTNADLVRAFVLNSEHRRHWVLRTLHRELLDVKPRAVIAILGLAYKENTHSVKNSPALALIKHLQPWSLRVFDPVVSAKEVQHPDCAATASALDAASGADALVIMTPWPEFREIRVDDIVRNLRGPIVIDPFRVIDGAGVARAGLRYVTLGVSPS